MSNSRLRTVAWTAAILAALAAAPGEVSAQTISSPYRFTPGVQDAGLIFGYAQDHRGYLGIGPGGGPLVGVRYGRDLTGAIGVELSGYVISGDRTVFDPQSGFGLQELGETPSRVASIDARLRFTLTGGRSWNGFAPYIVAGAGVAMDASPSTTLDESLELSERTDFGPSALVVAGGGTRWMPGDRFVFFTEIISHLWRQSTPNGYGNVEQLIGPLRQMDWIGVGGLVAGVLYRF